jgi:hypothetical protein
MIENLKIYFQEVCESHLCTVIGAITAENASRLLELAWQLNSIQLRRKVLSFVQENHAAITGSEGWIELMKNHRLVVDILGVVLEK